MPTPHAAQDQLHRLATAARLLDVSYDTLDRMLRRGELPYVRVGGQRRIEDAALRAYIDRRRVE